MLLNPFNKTVKELLTTLPNSYPAKCVPSVPPKFLRLPSEVTGTLRCVDSSNVLESVPTYVPLLTSNVALTP